MENIAGINRNVIIVNTAGIYGNVIIVNIAGIYGNVLLSISLGREKNEVEILKI